MKYFLIILLAFLLSCASTQNPSKNTAPFQSDNYVLLQEDSTYIEKRGIGVLWKEGLRKGLYRPELKNETGIFYKGPPGCVIQLMGEASMGPFDGGIWIPNDLINDTPRIYYYFNYNKGTAAASGGAIVSAILESGKGEITFMVKPKQKTFLSEITVSNTPL
jgi:hypothetical protein